MSLLFSSSVSWAVFLAAFYEKAAELNTWKSRDPVSSPYRLSYLAALLGKRPPSWAGEAEQILLFTDGDYARKIAKFNFVETLQPSQSSLPTSWGGKYHRSHCMMNISGSGY